MCVLNKLCLLSISKLCKYVTKLPEVQNVCVVLDVIAWICDGQNEEMQKALREQDAHLDVGMGTEHTPTGVLDTVGYILYVADCIHNYICCICSRCRVVCLSFFLPSIHGRVSRSFVVLPG